jgi:hypothetical protein
MSILFTVENICLTLLQALGIRRGWRHELVTLIKQSSKSSVCAQWRDPVRSKHACGETTTGEEENDSGLELSPCPPSIVPSPKAILAPTAGNYLETKD